MADTYPVTKSDTEFIASLCFQGRFDDKLEKGSFKNVLCYVLKDVLQFDKSVGSLNRSLLYLARCFLGIAFFHGIIVTEVVVNTFTSSCGLNEFS